MYSNQKIVADPDDEKRREMQKKLLRDARKLSEAITIEMAVRTQIDSTKQKIKELTKICQDENRLISDLGEQIQEEIKIANDLDKTGTLEAEDQVDTKNTDYIVQLENELKELYDEKVRLLKNRRIK